VPGALLGGESGLDIEGDANDQPALGSFKGKTDDSKSGKLLFRDVHSRLYRSV
jgi:hypothetical protein